LHHGNEETGGSKNTMGTSKNSAVVYTCITGSYDQLNNHTYIHKDFDYVCFTDNPSLKGNHNSSWSIKSLVFDRSDNVRNNRWHKLHPHLLFPEHKRSVYMDANINVLSDGLFADIDSVVKQSGKLSLGPHFRRTCIYDELEACLQFEKDDPAMMRQQIDLMRRDGFPENYGLFENNIIYREHHDKDVIKIMNDWWRWVENYSRRDQLSLMYVLWKNNFPAAPLSATPYRAGNKISLWHSNKHITKEELGLQKQLFAELFAKVKERRKTPTAGNESGED
jgi:hypothetical protein